MKIPHEITVPIILALFMVVIFTALSTVPYETIYHYWCKYKAQEFPEKYSECAQCQYWFSHKDMVITDLGTDYRWDCDECYSRILVYEK